MLWFLGICDNDNVNNLVRSTGKNVPGWTIDVNHGPGIKHSDDAVNCTGWWGFKWPNTPGNDGLITTTLNGNGIATLEFGSCVIGALDGIGVVKVFLNDVELASASGIETKKINFKFQHGSTLTIKEIGPSILQFNKFEVKECGNPQNEDETGKFIIIF